MIVAKKIRDNTLKIHRAYQENVIRIKPVKSG